MSDQPDYLGYAVRWNSEHGSGIARGFGPDGTHGRLTYRDKEAALAKAASLNHGRSTLSADAPTIEYTVGVHYFDLDQDDT